MISIRHNLKLFAVHVFLSTLGTQYKRGGKYEKCLFTKHKQLLKGTSTIRKTHVPWAEHAFFSASSEF
jgi:hypothetical protein